MKSGQKKEQNVNDTAEQPKSRGRSRRRVTRGEKKQTAEKRTTQEQTTGKWKRVAFTAAVVFLCLTAAAAGVYAYASRQYRTVFFPHTVINGLDASGKNVEQVKEMIQSGMGGYALALVTREGGSEQILGEEIGLHAEYDGTLEKLLAEQEPLKWGAHYLEGTSYTIGTMIACDKERLEQVLKGLECMDEAGTEAPEDAYLSDYISGSGYQIVPEKQGSRLVYDTVLAGVQDAILNLQAELSLEDLGAYEKPQITADNPELVARAEEWNRYAGVTVTYRFGTATEVLDGETIHTWLSAGTQGNAVLDEGQVTAYVKGLAEKYNTAYKAKVLKTSYGPTVTINKGNYGWRINQNAEVAALLEIIRSGVGQDREPIYSQTAASHGSQDYGDTYVEINLTAQHLFFYKNGSLLVESDFVSGNESKGWSTPAGAYPLTYKQRDATLKGEGYATPVSYWMPFNGGIGMHDAGWRSSFGGTLYKTGGSHGCINLPPAKAKTIYENISSGIPVLCYHLEGTQKGSTAQTTAPAETPAVPTETSTAAPETPTEPAKSPSGPDETTASQADRPVGPTDTPVVPSASVPEGPAVSPTETTAAPSGPAASTVPGGTAAAPAETPSTENTESYGPGGAPTKPDTGAVAGPGR